MKTILLLALFAVIPLSSAGQHKQLSFFGGYPFAFGDNFINKASNFRPTGLEEGYRNLFNMGIEASIIGKNYLKYGISLQWSQHDFKDTLLMDLKRPQLLIGYKIPTRYAYITPQVAVGYIRAHFGHKNGMEQKYDFSNTRHGISSTLGIHLSLRTNRALLPFIRLDTEFSRLAHPKTSQILNTSYNRNIFFFQPQIGISWQHKNKKPGTKEKLPTI